MKVFLVLSLLVFVNLYAEPSEDDLRCNELAQKAMPPEITGVSGSAHGDDCCITILGRDFSECGSLKQIEEHLTQKAPLYTATEIKDHMTCKKLAAADINDPEERFYAYVEKASCVISVIGKKFENPEERSPQAGRYFSIPMPHDEE